MRLSITLQSARSMTKLRAGPAQARGDIPSRRSIIKDRSCGCPSTNQLCRSALINTALQERDPSSIGFRRRPVRLRIWDFELLLQP